MKVDRLYLNGGRLYGQSIYTGIAVNDNSNIDLYKICWKSKK